MWPAFLEWNSIMKSRETLIRLKRFQVDEKRRRVAQIEMMIADFERMSNELDREIKAEEARSGITDVGHFAYPTYAKAAKVRRDNLVQSADNLRIQLDEAKAHLAEAFEEMKKVEVLDDREKTAERAVQNQRDQAAMDAIGLRAARA
jgi:flagellar protein FliJ